MSIFRLVPLHVHGALETFGALAIMAAPFALGMTPAAALLAVALGAFLFGLALSTHADRPTIPLATHAAGDYLLAATMIVLGLVFGVGYGDAIALIFFVGVGAAHMALTVSTRFSIARRA